MAFAAALRTALTGCDMPKQLSLPAGPVPAAGPTISAVCEATVFVRIEAVTVKFLCIQYLRGWITMAGSNVFQMSFAKVYGLLVDKAEKKGRTRTEVDAVTCWLTGYTPPELDSLLESAVTYGNFFLQAPHPNPDRASIRGVVCGVRVEDVADPLMREARYLDKLVDELAKGKPLEKVLRTMEGGGR